jgi:uncharacterized membrane protein YhaH (DUF805 family)
MTMPLRRYAEFSGRSRRKEYWMFTLGLAIVYALVAMVMLTSASADGFMGLGAISLALIGVVGLALFIPALAVQVRRFHDQDKSGWFVLLNLIPYIGGIIVLVMMCIEGTRGPNRFGPDPKGDDNNGAFA